VKKKYSNIPKHRIIRAIVNRRQLAVTTDVWIRSVAFNTFGTCNFLRPGFSHVHTIAKRPAEKIDVSLISEKNNAYCT